jgi:LCP family protein required for cell wall assembly
MLAIISVFVFFSINTPKEINVLGAKNFFSFFSNPFAKNSKNILVLGMTGEGNNGSYLTDTIMICNLNFAKNKVNVISIPRDLLVQIPNTSQFSKINGLLLAENQKILGQNKKEIKSWNLIKTKIEEISALKIDNVVIINLDGFRYFIDALGGINIYLDQPLYDPNLTNPDNPDDIFQLDAG